MYALGSSHFTEQSSYNYTLTATTPHIMAGDKPKLELPFKTLLNRDNDSNVETIRQWLEMWKDLDKDEATQVRMETPEGVTSRSDCSLRSLSRF
jgi:hypothetical protein